MMTVEDIELEQAKLTEALTTFMRYQVIRIVFDKLDGTPREINATLRDDMVPSYEKKTDRVKPKRPDQLTVIDADLGQWRNIKISNIRHYITPSIGNDIRNDPIA